MGTTATTEDIAEARQAVKELEARVTGTLDRLAYTAETDEMNCLAAELTDAHKHLRMARNILGDMEVGAGDFCPDDEL